MNDESGGVSELDVLEHCRGSLHALDRLQENQLLDDAEALALRSEIYDLAQDDALALASSRTVQPDGTVRLCIDTPVNTQWLRCTRGFQAAGHPIPHILTLVLLRRRPVQGNEGWWRQVGAALKGWQADFS